MSFNVKVNLIGGDFCEEDRCDVFCEKYARSAMISLKQEVDDQSEFLSYLPLWSQGSACAYPCCGPVSIDMFRDLSLSLSLLLKVTFSSENSC